jgi:hypothetical protein
LWKSGANIAAFGVFLMSANGAWAATGACATAPNYNALTSYTGSTSGCYQADKTFYNFAVGGTGDVIGGTPTLGLAGNFLGAAGTDSGNNFNVSDTFYGTAAGGAFTATGRGGATVSGDFIYDVNSSNILNIESPAEGTNYITSVTLGTVGSTGGDGNDALHVFEKFCLGTGTTPCTTNYVTIEASYAGSGVSTPTYSCVVTGSISGFSCASATSNTVNILLSDHVTGLVVENGYSLVAHGNTTITLTDFSDTFGESTGAPEPATFALMGSALAGILALRTRKKKA